MNRCDRAEHALLKEPALRRIVTVVDAITVVSSAVCVAVRLVILLLKVFRNEANALKVRLSNLTGDEVGLFWSTPVKNAVIAALLLSRDLDGAPFLVRG